MSICNVCMGKGHVIGQAHGVDASCPACHGNGFVEQTNEEWFTSLSTEEKAEWLSKHFHCGDCDIENRECFGTYSGCKETMLEWLKQPHTNE